ncbi:MAG: metal-dependent transcriptional regulator [Candidatus Saliniplasma sp.]
MRCDDMPDIDIDEALEILWTLEEEGDTNSGKFKERVGKKIGDTSWSSHRRQFRHGYRSKISDKVIQELLDEGYITEDNGKMILTPKGRPIARDIVRRHRLAERLLVDVFDMPKEEIEKPACEFEHLLSEEVTNRICTLLGHPSECPHGMAIPPGRCCREKKTVLESVIVPLSEVKLGEKVQVAYIHTKSHPRLHKLLSYDIGPGSDIVLHQKQPVFIIRAGETDIALERDIVKDIYVKKL